MEYYFYINGEKREVKERSLKTALRTYFNYNSEPVEYVTDSADRVIIRDINREDSLGITYNTREGVLVRTRLYDMGSVNKRSDPYLPLERYKVSSVAEPVNKEPHFHVYDKTEGWILRIRFDGTLLSVKSYGDKDKTYEFNKEVKLINTFLNKSVARDKRPPLESLISEYIHENPTVEYEDLEKYLK
jgi:hypothetical protein